MTTDLIAPITVVVVYTNRARITRSTQINLPAGETVLVLAGLPAQMENDSVRVSGSGIGVTIRGVDVKRDVQQGSDASKPLREQMKALQLQKATLEHDLQATEEQLAYYKAIKAQSSEEAGTTLLSEGVSFERVTQIADYIHQQISTIFEQQRAINQQLSDLDDQIYPLMQRITHGDDEDFRAGQAVHIAIEAQQAVSFDVAIDYIVNDASWKPLYDLRLLDNNSVELTYMAQITQETGEDWSDVGLSLSTAQPAISNTLPKPSAWYISSRRNDPLEMRLAELAPAQSSILFDDYDGQGMPAFKSRRGVKQSNKPKLRAQIQQATVQASSSGAVVTYSVGTPVTVLGNGEPHKTTIVITGLQVALDYLTAPRIAQEAYLRATITNTSEYTILSGEASIFHNSDFVGKTMLKTVSPTEEFKVQLGIDDRIKIERELRQRDTSKNMIGTKQQIMYRYAVTITNRLGKATKITVTDQYPLARESNIKVKLENASPPILEETDLHILTWELDLPDDTPRIIETAFTVEHDRNRYVHGLDD
ncbi:MAG: mucoidy inhibitor MuiA family protein [Chloroflexota bacterium]